jgi:hypothetical protein
MNKRLDIEIKKQISGFKKDSRIKECFHFDRDNCSNDIVAAHSIQNNGVLNLISEDINGNSCVYSLLFKEYNPKGQIIGLQALGKKSASTFLGFCGYHDKTIFHKIEDRSIDLNNDEQCFLLSYRAFAKDYHAKKETLQGYNTNEWYDKKEAKVFKEGLSEGSEIGLRDGNIVKERLNEILKNKQFSELEYFVYELDYAIPMALAASFNPEYSYKNKLLNKSHNPNDYYEFVNFSIQPTNDNRTLIVFSCLPEQKKSVLFIDELSRLATLKLEKSISSLAIAYVENTFISPSLWNKLGDWGQKILLEELALTNPIIRAMSNKFFHSKLNLLDKKFAV